MWSLWEGCPEECATQMRPQAGATRETEEPSMQDLSEAHFGQHIQSTRTNMYANKVSSVFIDVREEHCARLSI